MGGDKVKVTMQRHGVFRLCCLMAAIKKPAGISPKVMARDRKLFAGGRKQADGMQ